MTTTAPTSIPVNAPDRPRAGRRLMEGSEALAEACIVSGCKFFAGYPMTPFTELLEYMADKLPAVNGVCINAESELEAIGMTWGALATGNRAATGSTGQGLSLMQESVSEMTTAGMPLVLFNMARGQGDYFQSTRGGGHGDYRTIVLAPMDVNEGVELVQLAFHLADKWRNPVLFFGDYLLGHTYEAIEVTKRDFGPLPEKDWALNGGRNNDGESRLVTSLWMGKVGSKTPRSSAEKLWSAMVAKQERIAQEEVRVDIDHCDDAEVVVVAFGTPAKFVRYAVKQLRSEGKKVGYVRPITLWPYPYDQLAAAAKGARVVAVFENNGGQMIDDVRIGVAGQAPVRSIGGISTDDSGFGVGDMLDTEVVRERILAVLENREATR